MRFWQFDPETTALGRLGVDSGASAHAFGSFAGDRQADAKAGIFFRGLESLKDLEELGVIF